MGIMLRNLILCFAASSMCCDASTAGGRRNEVGVENRRTRRSLSEVIDAAFPESCSVAEELLNSNIDRVQIYPLKKFGDYTPFMCDCANGGWITFQRRFDGMLDFYRGKESYARGFGNTDGEFWLGLTKIYLLTRAGYHNLRIDMKFSDGSRKYADYSYFSLGPENSGFTLTVSGASGTANDRLSYHNGFGFSTKDWDLDRNDGRNCAQQFTGAWWYNGQYCYGSNLNGRFPDLFQWHSHVLSSSEMKIRKN